MKNDVLWGDFPFVLLSYFIFQMIFLEEVLLNFLIEIGVLFFLCFFFWVAMHVNQVIIEA